jgi:PleD family two-component response regulator
VTLRVLLAESATEDTLFLRDVLTDLDGARCWSDWVHVESLYGASWEETAGILATDAVDILLLDPDLSDCRGAETFRRAQAAAPDVPVILLVEPSSMSLAERMVRDGAQDFLLKKEVDCAPLARAMRNALERHRLLAATRATSMTDQLTGLLTRSAFLMLADRDRLLAERFGRRLMILVAEPLEADAPAGAIRAPDNQRRDLALVEAAAHLRSLAGPAALSARIGPFRFGLVVFDTEVESVEEIWARLHAATTEARIAFGAAVFDPQRPVPLDTLLEQAALDLCPRVHCTAV